MEEINYETEWAEKQAELKNHHIQIDDNWSSDGEPLKYIGGVDISFVKNSLNNTEKYDACACYIIMSYPDLKVVYEKYEMVKLTQPYISGFLAFREVDHLVKLIKEQKDEKPSIYPQVIFVDGNGLLHARRFGLACHLGVLLDIPTIGIGKTIYNIENRYSAETIKRLIKTNLKSVGDYFDLSDNDGIVLGACMATGNTVKNPIYVSIGNKISLLNAIVLNEEVSKYRIPEKIRQSDLRSREFLRKRGLL